jgi:putative DNA primase/helicase
MSAAPPLRVVDGQFELEHDDDRRRFLFPDAVGAIAARQAGLNAATYTSTTDIDGRDVVVMTSKHDDHRREEIERVAAFAHRHGARSVRIVQCLTAKGQSFEDRFRDGWNAVECHGEADSTPLWSPAGDDLTLAEIAAPVVVAPPDEPCEIARRFLESKMIDGRSTLVFHRGEFLEWLDGAWRPADDDEVRAEVLGVTSQVLSEINADTKDKSAWKRTSGRLVNDVLSAVKARVIVKSNVETPSWFGSPTWPADEVLATTTSLIHLPSLVAGRPAVAPSTPRFFNRSCLSYGYDPSAPKPIEFLKFLDSIWPDDDESQETLQELFGLCLVDDTSYQRIFMFIGPTRSGKGTASRILAAMIGAESVAGPTLAGLATNFGLESLIGKKLAIVADARLSSRTDQAVVVERLLSISGEDALTIDRKYKPPWIGTLSPRLLVNSNELPRLTDSSEALAGRMTILKFTRSFKGVEDRNLSNRIIAGELPGILLWAVEGWRRLQERGYFRQPASGQALLDRLHDLVSPIGQFLRERCEIGPQHGVITSDLYEEWRSWCSINGHEKPGTTGVFGKHLLAAIPQLDVQPTRENSKPVRKYLGVGLKIGPDF